MTIRGAILVGILAAATPAAAQPAGAQAETLFRQAKDLMGKKQYAEACQAFAASQKLDPAISTLLNEADCREKNGQLATAWGLFLEVERQTRGDKANAKLRDVAVARAKKLEPKLSTLAIDVAATPGVAIARNGEAIDEGAWNHKLPIDGGEYTILAKAPGRKDWSTKVTIASEGDAKTVEVPALDAAPAVVDSIVERKPPPTSDAPQEPIARHHRSRSVPIALAVGAGVLAGGALGFELLGRHTYDKSLAEQTDQARATSLWQSANHQRYVGEVMAIAGLASAGVAVWLFVRPDHADEARVSLAPLVTPTASGLVLDGRF